MDELPVSPRLRRYTNLPALFEMLSTRQITLLDPQSWDDKNDAAYMRMYRDGVGAASLLALCFSQANETYHHWRVFSNGESGVCVTFKAAALIERFNEYEGIRCGQVKYLTMEKARDGQLDLKSLPFIKRIGYLDESEYRVIYQSDESGLPSINIPIELSMVESISLSPWLHKSLSDSTKSVVKQIEGCSKIRINRSTLTSNDEWKLLAQKKLEREVNVT